MYEGPLRTNVKSVKTSILVLNVIQGHFGVKLSVSIETRV